MDKHPKSATIVNLSHSNNGKCRLTLEVDYGPVPDFLYPPWEGEEQTPEAGVVLVTLKDHEKYYTTKRYEHVEHHKAMSRPDKALLGRNVKVAF